MNVAQVAELTKDWLFDQSTYQQNTEPQISPPWADQRLMTTSPPSVSVWMRDIVKEFVQLRLKSVM